MLNYRKGISLILGTVLMSGIIAGCSQNNKTNNTQKRINVETAVKNGEILISDEGTYILEGNLEEGKIVVDADESKVKLFLDGVQVSNKSDAALYVKSAKEVIISLEDGSENVLESTGDYDKNDDDTKGGVIFSKGDLVFSGNGSLSISSDYGDGIDASGKVTIDSGTFDITCAGGSENGNTHSRQTPPGKVETSGTEGGEKTQKSDGKALQRPEGERPEGERPEFPENGEMPQRPDGQRQESLEKEQDNTQEDTLSSKGIKSDTSIEINGGSIKIDSADDSIHSAGNVQILAGEFEILSGDDGIHADGELVVDGGKINVSKSYEGLEGNSISINDGEVEVNSDDDGLNAAGDASGNEITINGGKLQVTAGGDGIDSNGDIEINGGLVYVDGPSDNGNSAIDYGEKSKAIVNGGTLVAVGSSGMAESFDESSTQGFMLVTLDEAAQKGSEITVTDESGNEVISYTAAKSFNCVEISCAEIKKGKSYTLKVGDTSKKIQMSELIYSDRKSKVGV